MSDTRNLGLVDFAVGLVNAVVTCNSPNGQVKFFGKFKLQKNCNQFFLNQRFFFGGGGGGASRNDFWELQLA